MTYTLGIDVGTSYTAAAVCRRGPEGCEPGTVVELGARSTAAPSVAFVDGDRWMFGDVAERRLCDRPELVVRDFKRRVGDPVPLVVGDRQLLPEVLVAGMVRWVVDQVVAREGGKPDGVVVTHPAVWGDYKRGRVRAALAEVGLGDVTFLSEPVAAAVRHAAQRRVASGASLAVYDLGGGTFDCAVVRNDADGVFHVLGEPGGLECVGGVDFDHAIFDHVREAAGLPSVDPADSGALEALARLRRECAEAKEALSADTETTIPVLLPGTHTRVRLVREDVEALVRPALVETVETFTENITSSGVAVTELDGVLLVGGSSRMPLVAELLSARLGRPISIDADPKASIALGAAAMGATAGLETARVTHSAQSLPVLATGPVAPAAPARPRGTRAPRWTSVVLATTAASAIIAASTMAVSSVVGDPRPPAVGAQGADPEFGAAWRPRGGSTEEPDDPLDPWLHRWAGTLSPAHEDGTTLLVVPVAAPSGQPAQVRDSTDPTGERFRSRPGDRHADESSATDESTTSDEPAAGSPSRLRGRSTTATTSPHSTATPTTKPNDAPSSPPTTLPVDTTSVPPATTAAPPVTTAAPPDATVAPPVTTAAPPPIDTQPPAETQPATTLPAPTETEPPAPASTDPVTTPQPEPAPTEPAPADTLGSADPPPPSAPS